MGRTFGYANQIFSQALAILIFLLFQCLHLVTLEKVLPVINDLTSFHLVHSTTVKLGYNELGYDEHLVVIYKFLGKIGHIITQMNHVVTCKPLNERWPVPSCSL